MKRFAATLLALGVPAFAWAATVNLGAPSSNVVPVIANGSTPTNLGAPASNVVIIDPATGDAANILTTGIPPVSDNFIAIPNLVGKTSALACIVGDSTATAGPTIGFVVDPSQATWGFLQEKLKHDLPGITWTFSNFAIGGANENNFLQTGTDSGLTLPSWFTDPAQTWASYVVAANCDVIFWMFGTNAATSGQSAGNSVALFMRQDFEAITGSRKLVLITTKTANPATDTLPDDANQSARKAQAAFKRTFARSNAGGYTSFTNFTNNGIGLIDLGRYWVARVDGHDPVAQYLRSSPSCIVSGRSLTNGPTVGVDATTVCYTTHGDFRLSFTLPSEGGADLYAFGGSHKIRISLGEFLGNYIDLEIGSLGGVAARYVVDGTLTNGGPSILGSTISTTASTDTTVTVSASQEHVVVIINGTTSLDAEAPRFVSEQAGTTPINVNWATAPTGSPTFNVTEFYEGIGYPTQQFTSYDITLGLPKNCTASTTDCQGGNGINHPRGNSGATDRQVIDAARFFISAGASAGTVTTTGTPASGYLTKFSGATSVTSGDLSGDVTTSGTLATAIKSSVTLTTPVLGVASATTINKVTLTTPATGSTLTIADGKTLTDSNTLTLTATDGSTLAIGAGGTLGSAAYVATGTSGATIPLLNGANTWSSSQTLSAALVYGGVTLSNAVTGTGNMVLSINPTLTGLTVNTITSTGAALNLDQSVNQGVNINTGTSTGTTTIGNSSNTGKLVIANLATGTNADTLCLSATNVVLLQAAACTISSKRFKEDIQAFTGDALSAVLATPTYSFRLKRDKHANPDPNARGLQVGLIAEDVAKIMPLCALYENDMKTPKSYRQECAIAMSFRAIQQQQTEIDWLKAMLATLAIWSAGLTLVAVRRSK